jgi:poly-beta-1,6-N-acetyl-D-glucosamine synthase
MPPTHYVLVTPVKNEATLIGGTIASVVAQTVLPSEWVIVSDGSTDGTDEIIANAAAVHPWIKPVRMPPRDGRCFAAVVRVTEHGIRSLSGKGYGFLGLLDSDVTFQNDYFERLMACFNECPRLGLAGGVVIDVGHPRDQFPRNRQDVPGAVQFFRRECFESLGGLIPIPEGGWDGMTCVMARMNGFETRLITDLVVDHHKPRNISQGGAVRRKWQMGVRDYAAGYHPLFELVKCVSRATDSPFLVGSAAWLVGYLNSALRRAPRVVPPHVVAYIQREQKDRLLTWAGLSRPNRTNRQPAGTLRP